MVAKQFEVIKNNESYVVNRQSFDRITDVMGKYNSKNSTFNANMISGLSAGSGSHSFMMSSMWTDQNSRQGENRDPKAHIDAIVKDCDNFHK
jgi:hypothetical protein